MKLIPIERLKNKPRHILYSCLLILFWYISMFPGRVGADTAGAIRLIQSGESTDWWTALFFWFLKLSSFNGTTIAITSLIQLIILSIAFYWLVIALPGSKTVIEKSFLIMIATPIFGAFGTTVGHDNLQVSGIFILLGIELRNIRKLELRKKTLVKAYISSIFCLLTTHTGIFLILLSLLILTVRKFFKMSIYLLLLTFFILTVSSIGVTKSLYNGIAVNKTSQVKYSAFIADLKCIAQNPSSEINEFDWERLTRIAPKSDWLISLSCANSDPAINSLDLHKSKYDFSSTEFGKTYLTISSKNIAIVAMAHIQRARGILAPPFFQAPDNQVVLDTKIPIGFGANNALQTGPEVIHPSNDEPTVSVNSRWLKPLNMLAQIPIFLVNQASWFWGWAGLWCWPIVIYWIWKIKIRKAKDLIISLYPIIGLHTILLLTIPTSIARYYMAAIILGIFVTILMLVELMTNKVTEAEDHMEVNRIP